jgi:hypothetical protein
MSNWHSVNEKKRSQHRFFSSSLTDGFHTIDKIVRWNSVHGPMIVPKLIYVFIIMYNNSIWHHMWIPMNGRLFIILPHEIRKNMVKKILCLIQWNWLENFFLDCCPDIFVDLKFNITLERRGGFYNYILILPCVLLSCLTCILFWLPVGEKYRSFEQFSSLFFSSRKVHRNSFWVRREFILYGYISFWMNRNEYLYIIFCVIASFI